MLFTGGISQTAIVPQNSAPSSGVLGSPFSPLQQKESSQNAFLPFLYKE